ncbi:hypothetical protein AB0K87_31410, partial [Streptomyces sp. NPDC053705]|uniref:hypothetical protein n=1 Tax=Streptomyces sp. NPDC053705 TaxID=3156668 RepID=UPI003442809E
MFFATAADGPRSVTYSGPAGASVEASAFAAAAQLEHPYAPAELDRILSVLRHLLTARETVL